MSLSEKVAGEDETWFIPEEDIDISDEIGAGAFSKVYKGAYFGADVAVKKMQLPDNDPETLRFVTREVEVLKSLKHPRVVQLYGLCKTPASGLWLVTEYVENRHLRMWLGKGETRLDWKLRVQWATDMANALAYLHSRAIIHRDLKSANMLVDSSFHVKVADFGFARKIAEDDTSSKHRLMTLCGTDEWMAPELTLGMEYDAKVDVFSYGIVLVEIITRLLPSDAPIARGPMSCFALNTDAVRSVAEDGCPESFLKLAFDCCEYNGKDRPTFREVVTRLRSVDAGLVGGPDWGRPQQLRTIQPYTIRRRTSQTISEAVAAYFSDLKNGVRSPMSPVVEDGRSDDHKFATSLPGTLPVRFNTVGHAAPRDKRMPPHPVTRSPAATPPGAGAPEEVVAPKRASPTPSDACTPASPAADLRPRESPMPSPTIFVSGAAGRPSVSEEDRMSRSASSAALGATPEMAVRTRGTSLSSPSSPVPSGESPPNSPGMLRSQSSSPPRAGEGIMRTSTAGLTKDEMKRLKKQQEADEKRRREEEKAARKAREVAEKEEKKRAKKEEEARKAREKVEAKKRK